MKRSLCLLLALLFIFSLVSCNIAEKTDAPSGDGENTNAPSAEENAPTVYTVPNGCFESADYTLAQNESSETGYTLTVSAKCAYALLSHTLRVDVFSKSGALLASLSHTAEESTQSGVLFSDTLSVSAEVFEGCASLMLLYEGTAEEPPTLPQGNAQTLKKCTVRFISGESEFSVVTVLAGERIAAPTPPALEGSVFGGWYTTESHTRLYDFSATVENDLSLYAKWVPDAQTLLNEATEKLVPSTVTVVQKSLVNGVSHAYQGSGVIFKVSEKECYLLTNCHVAQKRKGATTQAFFVYDAFGNCYTANLYKDAETKKTAIDPEYDLAVLHFTADAGVSFRAVTFGDAPKAGDAVIAIGAPAGQYNAVTVGIAQKYATASLKEESYLSNVSFHVLYHTAPTDHGSSGGGLFNAKLELVGINYAGSESFDLGIAVPSYRVKRFLSERMPSWSRP